MNAINAPEIPDLLNLDDDFPDGDFTDNQIVDILTQIENTNTNIVPVSQNNEVKTINVSNVANVNKHPMVPSMYFPNSTVTINYHFHN